MKHNINICIPPIERIKKIGGKEFFCQRLSIALSKLGIQIVKDNSQRIDIVLDTSVIDHDKIKGAKQVMRLDGAYHNTMVNCRILNKPIKQGIKISDAVIYQSKYSKAICDKYIGKFNGPIDIISNGFDPLIYRNISKIPRKFKYIFLTAAKWRPHKRLVDIIKSFRLANIIDSCLYIAGDVSKIDNFNKIRKKYIDKYNNIIYLGNLPLDKLYSFIKTCDTFIHLCWLDNCPNGVIEAIAARKVVVCNNIAGTPEIVRPSNGIICNIDKLYDFRPCQLYKPPKIDHSIVATALIDSVKNKRQIYNDHIDINFIAKKYIKFFKSLL